MGLAYLEEIYVSVQLNGSVVSALGIRARGPGFDFPVVPLFHCVATLGKLFTHIASPVSQLQETGVQKGGYQHLSALVIKCARLSYALSFISFRAHYRPNIT